MPGVRPDSIGPVWGVTAWRTSTSVVGFGGAGASAGGRVSGVAVASGLGAGGAVVTNRMVPAAPRPVPAGDRPPAVRSARMTDQPIGLHRGGPPETVLPPDPADVRAALDAARREDDVEARREQLRAVARAHPRCVTAWAYLGDVARDDIEAYAYFRVGYHRGLDQLRQSGWRGSGYVRSSHPENRGFLAALDGLRRTAAAIGETDEADRCAEFLFQLDPNPEGSGESRLPG